MRRRSIVLVTVLVSAVAGGGAWLAGVGPFPERVDRATAERARAELRELIAGLDDDVPGRACIAAFAEEAEPPVREFAPALRSPAGTIRGQVEELREREFERRIAVELTDPETYAERTANALGTPDGRDQLLLRAMDAIPRDGVLTELADERRGFTGFYFFRGDVLVAADDPDTPNARDRAVIAHELGHALSDQVVGLPRTDLWPYTQDPDLHDAAVAISEGDARLVELRYWLHHVPIEQQLATPEILDVRATETASPAHYLDALRLLPYRSGLDLACDAWLEGGMDAVDALYDDLPETVHEVLYGPDGPRIEPPEPGDPDGWSSPDDEPFGVGPLLTALQAPGNDPERGLDDALDRARAWAGGTSWVWSDDDDPDAGVVAIVMTDGGTGSVPLCDTVESWRTAAAPDATEANEEIGFVRRDEQRTELVRCDEDVVWFVVGPDLETIDAVVTAS